MTKSNFIDQIPAYLAGSLGAAEQRAFEKALTDQKALREALAIWQDLEEILAPAPEDQLLENIARLEKERSQAQEKSKNGWWFGLSFALLLVVLLSWLWWRTGSERVPDDALMVPPSQDSIIEPEDTFRSAPMPEIIRDTTPTRNTAPPTSPQTEVPFSMPEEPEEVPEQPVYAANYDPNPLIETEMVDQLRGGEVSFEMITPATETTLVANDGTILLSFSGEITTDLTADELSIRLLLLSNAVSDYQQSNYLATLPAELTPAKNGFTLNVSGTATVKPGLYYYFLEWEEEETYLKIGRLRVE